MAEKELFNQGLVSTLDNNYRFAASKPGLEGAVNITKANLFSQIYDELIADISGGETGYIATKTYSCIPVDPQPDADHTYIFLNNNYSQPVNYNIDSVPYSITTPQTIELDPKPTPPNDRIDIIAVDAGGVFIITGIESPTPVKPTLPSGKLELAEVAIPNAGDITVNQNIIYVAKTGNNSNSGRTFDDPISTLTKAVQLSAGISGCSIVCLDAGAYDDAITPTCDIFAPNAWLKGNLIISGARTIRADFKQIGYSTSAITITGNSICYLNAKIVITNISVDTGSYLYPQIDNFTGVLTCTGWILGRIYTKLYNNIYNYTNNRRAISTGHLLAAIPNSITVVTNTIELRCIAAVPGFTEGTIIICQFTGATTIINNTSDTSGLKILLQSGANYTTGASDVIVFLCTQSGGVTKYKEINGVSASSGSSGTSSPVAEYITEWTLLTLWQTGDTGYAAYKSGLVRIRKETYVTDGTKFVESRFDWDSSGICIKVEIKDDVAGIWKQHDYSGGITSPPTITTITNWSI